MGFARALFWQIPVNLLNGSLYFFVVGLCIAVFWDFTHGVKTRTDSAPKVSLCATLVHAGLYDLTYLAVVDLFSVVLLCGVAFRGI